MRELIGLPIPVLIDAQFDYWLEKMRRHVEAVSGRENKNSANSESFFLNYIIKKCTGENPSLELETIGVEEIYSKGFHNMLDGFFNHFIRLVIRDDARKNGVSLSVEQIESSRTPEVERKLGEYALQYKQSATAKLVR